RLRLRQRLGRRGCPRLRLPGRVGEPAAGAARAARDHARPRAAGSGRAAARPRPVGDPKEADVDYELLVIGGGTAGTWAARTGVGLGARTALVEQDGFAG